MPGDKMIGEQRAVQLLLLCFFIFTGAIAESAIRIRVRDPYMVPTDEEDKAVQGVALQVLECGRVQGREVSARDEKSHSASAPVSHLRGIEMSETVLKKIKQCTMEWVGSALSEEEHDQLILWLASDAEIDGPGVCGPYEIKRAKNRMIDLTAYDRVLCLFRINRDLSDKRTLSFFYFKKTPKGWRLSALR